MAHAPSGVKWQEEAKRMAMQVERLTVSIGEAATSLGVSERTLRELIARGDVPVVRIGRRVLLVKTQLEAWLSQQGVAV